MVAYSWTVFYKDSLLDISESLMLSIAFLNSLTNFSSSLLFLIIVHHLYWIHSLLINMLTVKKAWSQELSKSSRIKQLLISIELAQWNIKLITELALLELSVKIIDSGLYFIFSFHFILLFFSFSFLIFYF